MERRFRDRLAGCVGQRIARPIGEESESTRASNTGDADMFSLQFDHVWQMGPQLPTFGQDEWTVETKKGECKLFLDKMLEEAGPKSVVYARSVSNPTNHTIKSLTLYRDLFVFSFGSAVYSPTLRTLSILLSVFESLGTRFIMATGKCPPEIKEMLDTRIMKAGNRGLLIPWTPQKAILSHPASRRDPIPKRTEGTLSYKIF